MSKKCCFETIFHEDIETENVSEPVVTEQSSETRPKKHAHNYIQLSCTITPEDKDILDELSVYGCIKEKRLLTTSDIIRSVIRLARKHKESINFK